MLILWILLAPLTAFGLVMLIGDRLLKESLTHEGLCPVCKGTGGPCGTCNGFGMIIDVTKIQPQLTSDRLKETETVTSTNTNIIQTAYTSSPLI
ncbi:MAG: hypothetical protein F6K11_31615 [Leptolyngbya sp. SIO3F4]|nr:hypothetical protein [Leptolyngbya sp. SIO3F4]